MRVRKWDTFLLHLFIKVSLLLHTPKRLVVNVLIVSLSHYHLSFGELLDQMIRGIGDLLILECELTVFVMGVHLA